MSRRGTNCKVVLLGDTAVGKSCLAVRFVKNEFFEFQEPTIGAAFLTKNIGTGGNQIKLEIWDTAGQERYRSLAPMYYRGAVAAIVVYDITQKDTLNGAKTWIQELKKNVESCIIILVANKFDLKDERTITKQEVEEYTAINNIIHIETSAKSGHNVEKVFNIISEKMPKTEPSYEVERELLQINKVIKYKRHSKCC